MNNGAGRQEVKVNQKNLQVAGEHVLLQKKEAKTTGDG
jgi:hypothetical protein